MNSNHLLSIKVSVRKESVENCTRTNVQIAVATLPIFLMEPCAVQYPPIVTDFCDTQRAFIMDPIAAMVFATKSDTKYSPKFDCRKSASAVVVNLGRRATT